MYITESVQQRQLRKERETVNDIKANSKVSFPYNAKKWKKMTTEIEALKEGVIYINDLKKIRDMLLKQYNSVFSANDKQWSLIKHVTCKGRMS